MGIKMLVKLLYRGFVAAYPLLMTVIFGIFLNYIMPPFFEWQFLILFLIAYFFCLSVFFIVYYGNKIGVYRVSEILYSNTLSLLITIDSLLTSL